MNVGIQDVFAIIGGIASVIGTIVIAAMGFFFKRTLTGLEEADKKNAADIKSVEDKLNDLKSDLPLIYVTREDYIRIMNRVENKLDRILYTNGNFQGKED